MNCTSMTRISMRCCTPVVRRGGTNGRLQRRWRELGRLVGSSLSLFSFYASLDSRYRACDIIVRCFRVPSSSKTFRMYVYLSPSKRRVRNSGTRHPCQTPRSTQPPLLFPRHRQYRRDNATASPDPVRCVPEEIPLQGSRPAAEHLRRVHDGYDLPICDGA